MMPILFFVWRNVFANFDQLMSEDSTIANPENPSLSGSCLVAQVRSGLSCQQTLTTQTLML